MCRNNGEFGKIFVLLPFNSATLHAAINELKILTL